jgi:hypothetical protein
MIRKPGTMTLADVRRQYGVMPAMARRMIDAGYESENGTTRKLVGRRIGSRWAVTQASLNRWADALDRRNLKWATAIIRRDGALQLHWMATEETRRSFDRLTASGCLHHEKITCEDSGVAWHTYFLPNGHKEAPK